LVWAIGKSEPASADHVVKVTQKIRAKVPQRSGLVRILYGGSAGPGLFDKLKEAVDGCSSVSSRTVLQHFST
jgi:triosephosphate isomerase